MAIKLTDDAIKGQWTKQNNAHDKLLNAVVHIAFAMGLQLGEDGNVVEQAESALPVALTSTTQQSSSDATTLAKAIVNEMAVAMAEKELFVFDLDALLKSNEDFRHELTRPWHKWYIGHKDAYLRLRGLREVSRDGKSFLEETEDSPFRMMLKIVNEHEKQPKTHQEPRTQVPGEKIFIRINHGVTWLAKLLHKIYLDFSSTIWKFAAYNIAFCCALFGGFQYYENQKLLSEVKRTEVVRYILSGDPANKAMIEKIDTLLEQKGVERIYKSVMSKP